MKHLTLKWTKINHLKKIPIVDWIKNVQTIVEMLKIANFPLLSKVMEHIFMNVYTKPVKISKFKFNR